MQAKRICWTCSWLLGAALATTAAAKAQTATVRGSIGCTERGGHPAPGSYITVFSSRFGRSKPAPIGSNNTFYLYNIPPGLYVLEAWRTPTTPPKTFQLQVKAPYTDVPAIQTGC